MQGTSGGSANTTLSICNMKDHTYTVKQSPATLKRWLMLTEDNLRQAKQDRSNAVKREKRAKASLQTYAAELKKLKLLTEESERELKKYEDIPFNMFKTKGTKAYTDRQKEFAVTLHFYSPKAYNYVSNHFPLPSTRTLCGWMSHVDSRPGFLLQMINTLGEKRKQDSWQYSLCSVMIDGMAIKSHVQWDQHSESMSGLVDLGTGHADSDDVDVASEALVVLAVGVVGHWKAPIAYFLTNKLSAVVQSEIIQHCILELASVGMRVMAVVMDGLSANIGMVKMFGCNLDPANLNPFFQDPSDHSRNIAVIFDVCHMLKLIRNSLHSCQAIFIPGIGTARFSYLAKLHALQKQEDLHAANRLSVRHVDFHSQKMKVNLAAQLLSSSVAKGLEFVRKMGYEDFKDSYPIEYFCLLFDRLFDLLNSRSTLGKGYKAAMTKQSLASNFNFLAEAKLFLLSVTEENQRTLLCYLRKSTGFIGFACNIVSICKIAEELLELGIEGRPLKYLLTHKFSQDHLEILFSCIRKSLGYNNNPTASLFKQL